jgi:hypothetical protein
MKRNSALGAGVLGFAWLCAVACGDDPKGSLLDMGAGANGSGTGEGGRDGGLILDPNAGGGDDQGLGGLGAGGDASCAPTRLTGEPPLVNVLLVVDKSLSMNNQPEGFDTDKWTALRGALEGALDATADRLSYGLDLYPYKGSSGATPEGSCQVPEGDDVVVEVQAGTDAAPLILAALDDSPPGGATPTAAALAHAHAYFMTGAGKDLQGEKYVLLATDGGPNCNNDLTCTAASCTVNMDGLCGPNINCCDEELDPDGPGKCLDEDASVAAVAALAEDGIKTFVVGIPGTEAYSDTLDLLAAESGVENPGAPPAYFAVSAEGGVEGLAGVLQDITTGLITTCRLALENKPLDAKQIYVFIEGEQIPRDDPDGWRYEIDPPTIVLEGATCEQVETEGVEAVDIRYYCPGTEPK